MVTLPCSLLCSARLGREGIERHKSLEAALGERMPFVGCELCRPRDEVVIISLITWLCGLLASRWCLDFGECKCQSPLPVPSSWSLELTSTFPGTGQWVGAHPTAGSCFFQDDGVCAVPSDLVLHQSLSGMEGGGPCSSPKGTAFPGSGNSQGVWGAEPSIPKLLILQ